MKPLSRMGGGLAMGMAARRGPGAAVPSNALAQDDSVVITLDDGTIITVE